MAAGAAARPGAAASAARARPPRRRARRAAARACRLGGHAARQAPLQAARPARARRRGRPRWLASLPCPRRRHLGTRAVRATPPLHPLIVLLCTYSPPPAHPLPPPPPPDQVRAALLLHSARPRRLRCLPCARQPEGGVAPISPTATTANSATHVCASRPGAAARRPLPHLRMDDVRGITDSGSRAWQLAEWHSRARGCKIRLAQTLTRKR